MKDREGAKSYVGAGWWLLPAWLIWVVERAGPDRTDRDKCGIRAPVAGCSWHASSASAWQLNWRLDSDARPDRYSYTKSIASASQCASELQTQSGGLMTPIILNYNSLNNNKCCTAADGKCWFCKVPASERLFQSPFHPFKEVSTKTPFNSKFQLRLRCLV